MKDIINILNKEGKLVVTSRQVAEDFEKEHRAVLKAVDDIKEQMGVAQNYADLFIASEYQHEQNKQSYREYLLTRDGFSLLVMGFTGPKALEWKLKYIEAFNRMEKMLKNQPMSIEDMMISQLEEQKKIKNRLETVENKINKQMTIDHGQQRMIQREVGRKVYERAWANFNLNSFKPNEANTIIKKYFNSIYKEVKNRFGVGSYRDIKVKDYELAINYIKNWVEPQELKDVG